MLKTHNRLACVRIYVSAMKYERVKRAENLCLNCRGLKISERRNRQVEHFWKLQ